MAYIPKLPPSGSLEKNTGGLSLPIKTGDTGDTGNSGDILSAHNARAVRELDSYFTEVVLPKLSELHQAGKLPNLANDPLWSQVEVEWDKAAAISRVACDVDLIKKAMYQVIQAYEKPKSNDFL